MSVYIITVIYISKFEAFYNTANNTRWWLINKMLDKTYNLEDSTITVLFLGDSRPNAGIDFSKIKNSWSFCVGGTSPIENYYVLKKYLSAYSKPETLFLSISPRFLINQFAFWDLAVRNNFFTKDEFIEIYNFNELLNDTLLNNRDKIKFLGYQINFIKYYQADIRKSLIFFGKNKNDELIDFILNHKGQRPHPNLLSSCSDLNFETTMDSFPLAPIYDFYLTKIFETCLVEDIECVFFSMPMNESSYKNLNELFLSQYKAYIRNYQNIYSNFNISDSLYSYSDSLFGDASHLNSNGQIKFTDGFLDKYIN